MKPKASKDALFTLVKSLSKAEKRSFRLYVNRMAVGTDAKFTKLFDALDRLGYYDEGELLHKLKGEVTKGQLSNLKRHLYQQILISLRLIHIRKNIDIEIREQIDFARILYGKGMYMEALKLLDRVKQTALDHHQDILHLEILEFEKLIEARHITRSRSIEQKMEQLLDEARLRSQVTFTSGLYSNFNIQMQGWFIQYGHATTTDQREAVVSYFQSQLPKGEEGELTFFEKVNLHQARMWLYYILLRLEKGLKEATEWVKLLDENEAIRAKDPDLYVRGIYYQLMFSYLLQDVLSHRDYLTKLRTFIEGHQDAFNPNSQMLSWMYLRLAEMNMHMLEGSFSAGLTLEPTIKSFLAQHEDMMDEHRILLFQYKLACLFFGAGEYEQALDYLDQIVLRKSAFLREELHYFAGLLHLMCQVNLRQYDQLDYHLGMVKRSLRKLPELSRYQAATIEFIARIPAHSPAALREVFRTFSTTIQRMCGDPMLRKELAYLNTPAWVKSYQAGESLERLSVNPDLDSNASN